MSAQNAWEEIQMQEDYVTDCTIDTDLEILIPDKYVESITERLSLYTRLDNCDSEEELAHFHSEMIDRFGPIPQQVEDLFVTVRCRKLAVALGFERLMLKDEVLRCYFINKADSKYFESAIFDEILKYIQTGTNKAKLKQTGRNFLLTVNEISTMESLHRFLRHMHKAVISPVVTAN